MIYLYVALGGAAGSVARFALGGWTMRLVGGSFPWPTLLINIAGSFLLGMLLPLYPDPLADRIPRALLAIGFCGGFTTFSTFSYESWDLLRDGMTGAAAGYVIASVVLGLVGVFGGIWLGGRLG